ncbi:MAG: sterol desaturase family protein [Chitinophagales bacterium]
MLRYVVFSGTAFLIFYRWKREKYIDRKIQERFPDKAQMIREAVNSVSSIVVFALTGVLVFWMNQHGWTKIYTRFADHSMAYFVLSVVAFIFLHDTYFYWMHRLMHWDKVYKYVHRTHHLSTNPTPWAAFAFHPLEAFVEVGILLIMVFLMPLHPLAILAWILYMTLLNVMGHLGFELFPKGFTIHPIFGWHNTSVHHNMHHRLVKCNYGLYFNIWDRLMGTNHKHYHEEFDSVARKF